MEIQVLHRDIVDVAWSINPSNRPEAHIDSVTIVFVLFKGKAALRMDLKT